MGQILRHIFYSIRPSACLGSALFALGAFQPIDDYKTGIIIFLSVFSGSAGCFLINDIADREKDLLNNKKRPIADGRLEVKHAKIAALLFVTIYFFLSLWLGIFHLIIFAITTIIFLVYPAINNRYGLASNLLVALSTCLSFIYGVGEIPSSGSTPGLIILSIFFIITVREIMLDGLDIEGDKAIGRDSLPARMGNGKTLLTSGIGYLFGSAPLLSIILNTQVSAILILLSVALAALWIPFLVSVISKKPDWQLFNVRTSHLFFALIIVTLFLR